MVSCTVGQKKSACGGGALAALYQLPITEGSPANRQQQRWKLFSSNEMILCVNLNTAIDKTVTVNDFRLNAIHRPEAVWVAPGGKGVNVARALKTLGEDPLVIGWAGGHAGHFIEEGLQKEGIQAALIQVTGESRTCLTIIDRQKARITEIYEQGEAIPASAQEAFIQVFLSYLPGCRLVTLSGSLPPGVPHDFYANLIMLARHAEIPSLLDTSGAALSQGFEQGKPYLVKPNREELYTLIGRRPRTIQGYYRAAVELSSLSGGIVAISLGKDGLVAAGPPGGWQASPPTVDILSAVGSGDAVLAGLAYGTVNHLSFEETLRMAAAAGTANALRIGAGRFHFEEVQSIALQVRVVRLP